MMDDIDAYGGVVKAIEDGWLQMRLAERATERRRKIDLLRDDHRRPERISTRGIETDDVGEVFRLDPDGGPARAREIRGDPRPCATIRRSEVFDDLAAASSERP